MENKINLNDTITVTGNSLLYNPNDYYTITTPESQTWTTSTGSWILNSALQPHKLTFDSGITIQIKPDTKEKKEQSSIEKKIEEHLKRRKQEKNIYFKDIKEYVPGKVYEFTIEGTTKTFKCKTICDDNDVFDLEMAFYLALMKYRYEKQLTPEGYFHYATLAKYEKADVKIVKNGLKLFKLLKEKEIYEKEQEELIKERHRKYVQKKKDRDRKRKEEANQGLYKIIREAIEDAK